MEDTEAAFQALKDALCSHPVLVTPDFSKNLLVQTDASDTGVGAVLSQEQEGEEHPIIYVSRKLLPREKKYSIVEKALDTLKYPLKYYLLGRKFTLRSSPSCGWHEVRTRMTVSPAGSCPYSDSLSGRDRSGAQHGNANALSRRDANLDLSMPPSQSGLGRGGGVPGGLPPRIVIEGRYVRRRWLPLLGIRELGTPTSGDN
jgi:hypothetical protein